MPAASAKLILLDSAPITLDAKAALPRRLKLMGWGANASAKGTFIVNETTLAQLSANQRRANFDTIALDFEHNTVKGSPSYKGEPAKVAAHGTPEVIAGDGLYLNNIEWTADGTEFIGGRHYPDYSPSILTNDKGEVIFLHSVAACRQGALIGGSIQLSADFPTLNIHTNQDPMKDQLIKLLTAAGIAIPDNATEAQLTTLAAELEGKLKTPAADPKKDEAPALADTLKTLTASITTLTAEVTALKAKQTGNEELTILSAAAAEGKVVPKWATEGATKLAPDALKLLVADLPVTVPLERRTPLTTPAGQTAAFHTLSAEEEVRKNLGLTKEQWDKANKAA